MKHGFQSPQQRWEFNTCGECQGILRYWGGDYLSKKEERKIYLALVKQLFFFLFASLLNQKTPNDAYVHKLNPSYY